MLEVLEAGQHHCEGKLAQARRGNLEQEQRRLLHQQTCPHAVRLLNIRTQTKSHKPFLIKNEDFLLRNDSCCFGQLISSMLHIHKGHTTMGQAGEQGSPACCTSTRRPDPVMTCLDSAMS